MPTVAIVGNDAVLAAAPATPVQFAHACLRRGFSVAVPASWGDELVAAEAVRRLVGRDKGPAVMCVCPFVRSRLLAPGPDLEPFLVSLVAPPVATARYLRALYGEHGVHITYIGGCPSADDSAIDARLTPDDFLADIADRGIALSEQPLVFDSIVPPDRRRWCSVPGGVPSPEILWNEADGRTLVEIDRDEVSTDLAQHIITREHVLIDLAPSLGCACSGAIAPLAPRSARVAVTALEPPRALGPVIDPATVVPLDAPITIAAAVSPSIPVAPSAPAAVEPNVEAPPPPEPPLLLSEILDREIGTPVSDDVAARIVQLAVGPTEPVVGELPELRAPEPTAPPRAELRAAGETRSEAPRDGAPVRVGDAAQGAASSALMGPQDSLPPRGSPASPEPARSDEAEAIETVAVIVGESDIETLVESPIDAFTDEPPEPTDDEAAAVQPVPTPEESPGTARGRTPTSIPVRHGAANVPRTAAAGGLLLPRAYVAKRRTPAAGVTVITRGGSAATEPPDGPAADADARDGARAPAVPSQPTPPVALVEAGMPPAEAPPAARTPPPARPEIAAPVVEAVVSATRQSVRADVPRLREPAEKSVGRRGLLVFLLVVALVAVGVFVALSLR